MIHLLNLEELYLEHISARYHPSISSGSIKLAPLSLSNEVLRQGYKCCLKNVKVQLSWKRFGNLTDEGYPIYSIKKFKFENI